MAIETLKTRLPDYAKDIRLNLGSLAGEPSLTQEQRAGTLRARAWTRPRSNCGRWRCPR
jgi:alkyl hydroperoxide reductase subunit D